MNINKEKITVIFIILTVVASALAVYFYARYLSIKTNPQQMVQEETADLVEAVGKLILLPSDETPTIATVTDPAPLSSQPFFVNAKKGDKVLIYTSAKKAILYNTDENRIVEVAPVNIGGQ